MAGRILCWQPPGHLLFSSTAFGRDRGSRSAPPDRLAKPPVIIGVFHGPAAITRRIRFRCAVTAKFDHS
jgi:hypothetical protein